MRKPDFFYRTFQRNREWDREEYYSTIDVVDRLDGQSATLESIREANEEFYRKTMPEAFAGLDRIEAAASSQAELLKEQSSLMAEQVRGLEAIGDELHNIRNSLDYGFELLAERIDTTNDSLDSILETLRGPTRIQAEEHASKGIEAMRDGFFDEALFFFNKVIDLDPVNFVAWYKIGVIRLEHLGDVASATTAFSSSRKYAKPKSPEIYSRACYQLALIDYAAGNVQAALDGAHLAFAADSSNMQVAFLLAELHAVFDNTTEARKYLAMCEAADLAYFFKSASVRQLNASGVHRSVFGVAATKLRDHNQTTNKKFGAARNEIDNLRGQLGLKGGDRGLWSVVQYSEIVVTQDDYVSCRIGHDTLKNMVEGWRSHFDRDMQDAENILQSVDLNISSIPAINDEIPAPPESSIVGSYSIVIGVVVGLIVAFAAMVWMTIKWGSVGGIIGIVLGVLVGVLSHVLVGVLGRQVQRASSSKRNAAALQLVHQGRETREALLAKLRKKRERVGSAIDRMRAILAALPQCDYYVGNRAS